MVNSKKKVSIVLSLILCFVVIFSSIVVEPVYAGSKEVEKPDIATKSAAIYCLDTDSYVYKKKINKKCSPYSITKLMTGYLASKNLPMDKKVVIGPGPLEQYGSLLYLQEGEIISVEDLLYGTMLHSGNDAAYALGETVSGTNKNFIKKMNETAEKIGCKNTHFVNANGLEEKDHYSTAADMIKIMKLAYSDKNLTKIMSTPRYTIKKTNMTEKREIVHSSKIMRNQKEGVMAVKTGTWDYEATAVLVYKKHDMTFIIALMKSNVDVREKDTETLIKYCDDIIEKRNVVPKDQFEGKAKVKRGAVKKVKAVTEKVGSVYVPQGTEEKKITTKAVFDENLKAPIKKGERVGTLNLYVGKTKVQTEPLIAEKAVPKGWITSYIGLSNAGAMMLLVVIVIIAVTASVYVKKKKRQEKRKNKAKEMAYNEMKKDEK